MEATDSPQLRAVGEVLQKPSENRLVIGNKPSYTALSVEKQSAGTMTKLEISPILIQNGIPTVEFTVDEVNSFTREEGLHQAVIIKFSYGKPAIHDLRQTLPRLFDVRGKCNIGLLEHRHILVRFDLFEDFVKVVSRTSGYVRYKGDDFFFRTFPWTMGFNPREEMSKAVVWISFPDLPANYFARKSLMSIASAVGKPLAVDKATNERTRPSTARVKVLVNLIDKHAKKVIIKVVDIKSGNLVEYEQKIVFDNLPKYCTYCLHQGHEKKLCRWLTEDSNDKTVNTNVSESKGSMLNSGRDASEILNEIIAGRKGEVVQLTRNKDVAKKNVDDATVKVAESVQFRKVSYPVNIQQNTNALPEKSLAVSPSVFQQISPDEGTSVQQNTVSSKNCDQLVSTYAESLGVMVDHISGQNVVGSTEQKSGTAVKTTDVLASPIEMSISNAYVDTLGETGSKMTAEVISTPESAERLTPANVCDASHPTGSHKVSQTSNPKMQPIGKAENFSDMLESPVLSHDTPVITSARLCEMTHNQKPDLEEVVLTSNSAAINAAINAQSKIHSQHARTMQRSNLKSSNVGHQLTSKNAVISDLLNDSQSPAETDHLVENIGHQVQQQSTVPLRRGEQTTNQTDIMQTTLESNQGAIDCQKNGSEGNQCNGSGNEEIVMAILRNAQPIGQQQPKDNALIHAPKQLTGDSTGHFSKNTVSLRRGIPTIIHNDTLQISLESNQCANDCHKSGKEGCQHTATGNAENRIDKLSSVQSIEQQQLKDIASLTAHQHLLSDEDVNSNHQRNKVNIQLIADKEEADYTVLSNCQATQHGKNSEIIGSGLTIIPTGSNSLEQSAGQKASTTVATIYNSHPEDLHLLKESNRNKSTQKKVKHPASKCTEIIASSNSVAANESKHVGKEKGVVKVKSYPPISISGTYSGEDINDSGEFSSLEGMNKKLIVANMRDMVIKSKLWDQHYFDDDENWDEGPAGRTSDEEGHLGDCNSSEEDSDDSTKQTVQRSDFKQAVTSSKLNRHAPSFIPKKDTAAAPLKAIPKEIFQKGETSTCGVRKPMNDISMENKLVIHSQASQHQQLSLQRIMSSHQSHLENEMEENHLFEEGEEDNILAHCRKNAARIGDLSPRQGKISKKSYQRGKSWDGKIVEDVVRKLPMRLAKQKQISTSSKSKTKS